MPKITKQHLRRKAKKIKLIALDVDGVLTDGRITLASDGGETKSFDVRDGLGVVMARRAGFELAIVSGRPSKVTTLRAKELGIKIVRQGAREKLEVLKEITEKLGVGLDAVLFMGDDTLDLAAMKASLVAVAPADAHPAALKAADWVTRSPGGRGAVREIIDILLEAVS